MPLRPLPSPYRIGVDICSISRVKSILLRVDATAQRRRLGQEESLNIEDDTPTRRVKNFEPIASVDDKTNEYLKKMNRHLNPHFLTKLFRAEEIEFVHQLHENFAGGLAHDRLFEYIAGRWAAKEAIIKATSPRRSQDRFQFKPTFHDILIWPRPRGAVMAAVLSRKTKSAEQTRLDHDDSNASSDSGQRGTNIKNYLTELDGDLVDISISHEREYAIATALFCSPAQSSDD